MRYLLKPTITQQQSVELKAFPGMVSQLLVNRDITDKKAAEDFVNKNPDVIGDPNCFLGSKEITDRIIKAIKDEENILIFADYDADGIPGSVVLSDFFRKIEYPVEVYFPHRNKDGFGLNMRAVDDFIERKISLVVTIDCGITDVNEIAKLQKNGIDVIVTDHHHAGEKIPNAFGILNPKQQKCEYSNEMLCGAAVAFKLVQLLSSHYKDLCTNEWQKTLLDMVGIATLSDMVPLTGENRLFAFYGLQMLRISKRLGVQKLCKLGGVKQLDLTEQDVVFSLTPKINAASRMGIPKDAYNLLVSTDEEEASKYLKILNSANNSRKKFVDAIAQEVVAQLVGQDTSSVIVVGNKEWKPSLLGLVASKLVDQYHVPAFVWGQEDADHIKGSCRGVNDVSLHEMMTLASDSFLQFGGHANAGGFESDEDKVKDMQDKLRAAYEDLQSKVHEPETFVDQTLDLEDVTPETYNEIHKLAPYGEANPAPLFVFPQTEIYKAEAFGKNKEHTKLVCRTKDFQYIDAIAFFKSIESLQVLPQAGDRVNIVGVIEYSQFMGRRKLRLKLIDVIQSDSWK